MGFYWHKVTNFGGGKSIKSFFVSVSPDPTTLFISFVLIFVFFSLAWPFEIESRFLDKGNNTYWGIFIVEDCTLLSESLPQVQELVYAFALRMGYANAAIEGIYFIKYEKDLGMCIVFSLFTPACKKYG